MKNEFRLFRIYIFCIFVSSNCFPSQGLRAVFFFVSHCSFKQVSICTLICGQTKYFDLKYLTQFIKCKAYQNISNYWNQDFGQLSILRVHWHLKIEWFTFALFVCQINKVVHFTFLYCFNLSSQAKIFQQFRFQLEENGFKAM